MEAEAEAEAIKKLPLPDTLVGNDVAMYASVSSSRPICILIFSPDIWSLLSLRLPSQRSASASSLTHAPSVPPRSQALAHGGVTVNGARVS